MFKCGDSLVDFLEEESPGYGTVFERRSRLHSCLCDLACHSPPWGLDSEPHLHHLLAGASGQMLADLCCGRVAARQF